MSWLNTKKHENKMIKSIVLVILFTVLIIFNGIVLAQDNQKSSGNFNSQNQLGQIQSVFNDISNNFSSSNISSISKYFGSQTYFSLKNGVNGYYSSNQAFYVLENFLKEYQVISFRLDNVKIDSGSPYATGIYKYDIEGKRDSAQVYISLKKVGDNWKISQLSIN